MIPANLVFFDREVYPHKKITENQFVVFCRCEGYSLAQAIYGENDDFLFFNVRVCGEDVSYFPDDIDLWARLPNSHLLVAS